MLDERGGFFGSGFAVCGGWLRAGEPEDVREHDEARLLSGHSRWASPLSSAHSLSAVTVHAHSESASPRPPTASACPGTHLDPQPEPPSESSPSPGSESQPASWHGCGRHASGWMEPDRLGCLVISSEVQSTVQHLFYYY
eukprot:2333881-Rhodomonas_salina.2